MPDVCIELVRANIKLGLTFNILGYTFIFIIINLFTKPRNPKKKSNKTRRVNLYEPKTKFSIHSCHVCLFKKKIK